MLNPCSDETLIPMSRYRTKSWRAFEPGVATPGVAGAGRKRAEAPVPRFAPSAKLRILGVDPGSRRTGFGVIECRGADYVHIAHGCLNVGGVLMAERLRMIFEGLEALIGEHQPGEVAVERVRRAPRTRQRLFIPAGGPRSNRDRSRRRAFRGRRHADSGRQRSPSFSAP